MLERLPHPIRGFLALGTATYHEWRMHRTIRLGAGIAYYGLFALIPILSLSIAVAGLVLSDDDVQAYLVGRLEDVFGPDAAGFSSAIATSLGESGTIVGLGIVGAGALVLAASLLVLSLQDALDTIWELPVRSGFRRSFLRRVAAFAVILSAGLVLIAGFVINAITALIERLVPDAPILESISAVFGFAASWALGVGVFVLLFRYLPDSRAPWRAALIGAATTTVLVAVGTSAIGFYLRTFGGSSVTGATGGAVLLLLWIYYEAQIVLVGAEFTRVVAHERVGSPARSTAPVHDPPPNETETTP
ncbi:MAG: YihY/virulence factor BrkB family protein [Ilumatobacteraceae bacterium]